MLITWKRILARLEHDGLDNHLNNIEYKSTSCRSQLVEYCVMHMEDRVLHTQIANFINPV